MKRFLLGAVMALLVSLSAEACEKCGMYFDSQALQWCKYCQWSYCGYFDCSIYESAGLQYCDSTWEEDDGSCFTSEGTKKQQCGPWEIEPSASANSHWRLVGAEVKKPASAAEKS